MSELVGVQGGELGVGNGLLDILLADVAAGDALENLDGLLGTLADGGGGTGKLDGQKAGVGVGEVGGVDREARGAGGGLGEEAEAGSPLDGGLAAEEGGENGDLRLGRVDAGAGESNDDGVSGTAARSLLTTKVLAGLGLEGLAASGGRGDVLEELANPLGEGVGSGTVGDDGDVGLGVDNVGEAGNVLLVQVLLVGSRRAGVEGGTEASVEGDGMGVIEGNGGGIGVEGGLLGVEDTLDILVELVG